MTQDRTQREKITLPENADKLLLLSCCAPCSCEAIERLVNGGVNLTVLFYNPNIHPEEEYEKRKKENKMVAAKYNVPFVDLDYETDNWFGCVEGLEGEPERGKRCDKCFFMRLQKAAEYAVDHGFKVFSSTLGVSRWKDLEQVNRCANLAAEQYPGLIYWDINWRKDGGQERARELVKKHCLYEQDYCGCVFSQRERKTN